jgi:hypothetical protein
MIAAVNCLAVEKNRTAKRRGLIPRATADPITANMHAVPEAVKKFKAKKAG